jgi:hypothetical protein
MLGLSGSIYNSVYLNEKQSSFVVRMDHQCQSYSVTGRISNNVYLQEKPASFVEGFLTVYIILQEKPASFVVRNGGWVIYASPNWKGKAMYCFDGKEIRFA